MDYCPCISIQALGENKFIVRLCYGRWRYTLFSWLLLDLHSISQTSYKQVNKQLMVFYLNSKNMVNFTALYTSYLCFTFGTNSTNTSPCAYGLLVFFLAFFHIFMLFEMQGLSIMCRTRRPVRVQLKCIRAGVVRIALSWCVSLTREI